MCLRVFLMKRTVATVILILAGLYTALGAISEERTGLLSLVERAEVIVRVSVVSASSSWKDDAYGRHIWTSATLQPLTVVKGAMPQIPFEMEFMGGTVDGFTEVVTHSLTFEPDEEAVLFLAGKPLRSIDGDSGKWVVREGKVCVDRGRIQVADFERILSRMSLDPGIHKMTEGPDSIPSTEKPSARQSLSRDGMPNLIPYQPFAWSSKIVVSTTTGTSTDNNPLFDTDTLYIDWAIGNSGTSSTSGPFVVMLCLDGSPVASWPRTSALDPLTWYSYPYDHVLGGLPAGDHLLELVVDAFNTIPESDETDNVFSRTITVLHTEGAPVITQILPGPVPAGTDSEIVILGSDFGDTRGTGRVEFFYRTGNPKISPAPEEYLSWADTVIRCRVPTGVIGGYSASAGSGPVTVTNDVGLTGPGFRYKVIFGNGWGKWAGSSPLVDYLINENTSDTMGEGAAIQAAAETWNAAGVHFSFRYAGPTDKTVSSVDGENTAIFGATYGSLAMTSYLITDGVVIEADMVFNDNLTWSAEDPTPVGTYDIQSVALHEFVHFLNLRDQYGSFGDGIWDEGKVMYGFYGISTQKRSLHTADLLGIRHLYLKYGDTNGDAGIDATDMNLLAGFLAGSYGQGENGFTQPVNADVDGSTAWNARDLTTFILFLNGSITVIPRY